MKAEFLKIRSLPTPFWIGVSLGVCFLIGLVFSIIKGVGQDQAVLDLAIGLPSNIASLVLGAWIVGVEFGQNTLRRVLSADPRRVRLVLAKLGTAVATVFAMTVALWLVGMVVFSFAGAGHETLIDMDQALRNGASTLLTNLVYVIAAMGLAWITRSMAGGMMIAFAFFFVIDFALILIPDVGHYALGSALSTLDAAIRGNEPGIFEVDTELSVAAAATAVAAWLIVFFGLGIWRTKATEVK